MTAPDGTTVPYVPRVRPATLARIRPRRVSHAIERRRFLAKVPPQALALPDVEVTRVGRRLRLVRVQPGSSPEGVRSANLRLVVELCEAHDIDYFLVSAEPARQPRVGVPAPQWARLVDALIATAAVRPLYAGVEARARGRRQRWPALLSESATARAARTQRRIEIFEMVAPASGTKPYDRPYGCLVERWDPDGFDGLLAPAANGRTTHVAGPARSVLEPEDAEDGVRSLEAFAGRDVFTVDFDVDAVCLWVDGSDPAWQERQRAALAAHGLVVPEASADERFREHGELRYALRSLERYAPWVRTLYLVTDQQVPTWLDEDHPRIRLVDHKELFGDEGALPTFNSHAIGARLHHIEGLSEHYLYLNDDVFFGRPLAPSTFFFSNGLAKFFLSRATLPMTPEATPHEQARRNVATLLERDFGPLPRRTFFHTPIPQRRSLMLELEERYPEVFASTWASSFRSASDYEVNWWLHAYFGYLTGRAVPASISYDYFNLALPTSAERMHRLSERRGLDAFCINDSAETTPEQHAEAIAWLESYYPGPAAWER